MSSKEIETRYGWFIVVETATGIMAEKFGTHSQFFLDGEGLYTQNTEKLIMLVEQEYESKHNL